MRPNRCRALTPALASGYGRQNSLAAPMISGHGDADCNCSLPKASPFDGVIIWVLGRLTLTNCGTGITYPGHAACTFGRTGVGRNSVLVLLDDGGTCRSNVLALLDWFSHEDPNGQLLLSTPGKARLSVAALRQTAFIRSHENQLLQKI